MSRTPSRSAEATPGQRRVGSSARPLSQSPGPSPARPQGSNAAKPPSPSPSIKAQAEWAKKELEERADEWTQECRKRISTCWSFAMLRRECKLLEKQLQERATQPGWHDPSYPNRFRDIVWAAFSTRKARITKALAHENAVPYARWAPWPLYPSDPLNKRLVQAASSGGAPEGQVSAGSASVVKAKSASPAPSSSPEPAAGDGARQPRPASRAQFRSPSSYRSLEPGLSVEQRVGHNSENLTYSMLRQLADPKRATESRRAESPPAWRERSPSPPPIRGPHAQATPAAAAPPGRVVHTGLSALVRGAVTKLHGPHSQ